MNYIHCYVCVLVCVYVRILSRHCMFSIQSMYVCVCVFIAKGLLSVCVWEYFKSICTCFLFWAKRVFSCFRLPLMAFHIFVLVRVCVFLQLPSFLVILYFATSLRKVDCRFQYIFGSTDRRIYGQPNDHSNQYRYIVCPLLFGMWTHRHWHLFRMGKMDWKWRQSGRLMCGVWQRKTNVL